MALTKGKDGRYHASVYIGTVNGVPKRKSIAAKTEKELRKKKTEIQAKYNRGVDVTATSDTFGFWLDRWLMLKETEVSENWFRALNINAAKLEAICPLKINRLQQFDLVAVLKSLAAEGYPNDNNVFITEIDYAKKVLDGFLDDPRYFSLLYEPDGELTTGDQWQTNDLIIYQSNPVANDYEYIFEDLVKKRKSAILYESKRENYLCKHNNILYKSLGTEGFVEITKVRECRIHENLGFWRGKRVWIGLDLSLSEDNTAVAMLTEYEGEIYAKVWGFLPANRVDLKSEKENVDYRRLIREGACFGCGEEIIDYGFIERFIIALPEKYGVEIVQVGFDRYNAISTVQKLEAEAITCVEIRQHSSVLHRPTKLLKEAILSGHFHYDENGLLEINFTNARCTEDTNLNKYVNKKKSAGKVDLVVAVINALCLLQLDMETGSWGAQIIE